MMGPVGPLEAEDAGFRRHGGRLAEAQACWPDAPRPWIDLSTGVNPKPYPAPRATAADRARLPSPAMIRALEVRAAAAFGVDPGRVLATAGAEAALRLLPFLFAGRTAAVATPTYGGHASAWTAAGRSVEALSRLELLRYGSTASEVVVLVNPNNPDGATSPADEVLALTGRLDAGGRWLVVDESFAEPTPECSVAPWAGGRLLVLRSFGKFYGLAGLRLGFLLGDPDILSRARALQGDWPVSADALAAGLAAYGDGAWSERTRRRLRRDARRLDTLLLAAGFSDVQGCPLFRLAHCPDASRRFEALARRGILTRPFEYAPDRLRFGLPPSTAWSRLEAALLETAGG
jgi:cobalamin biosynthesis protein CobC